MSSLIKAILTDTTTATSPTRPARYIALMTSPEAFSFGFAAFKAGPRLRLVSPRPRSNADATPLLVTALLVISAAPLHAQSLFSTQGLGAPVDPLDPRARALGNVGTGLPGLNSSLVNPADLAGIVRRGVSATIQPYYGSDRLANQTDDLAGTRFPVIQLVNPLRAHVVIGLGYGGFLDQTWSVFANGSDAVEESRLLRAMRSDPQVGWPRSGSAAATSFRPLFRSARSPDSTRAASSAI